MKLTDYIFSQMGVSKYKSYLDLSSYRHKLLSGNVANVSTPGYKAKDISFTEEYRRLTDSSRRLTPVVTQEGHIPVGDHPQADPKIREERIDRGMINSVDIESAITNLSENELLFDAGAQFLQMRFEGMKKAITSE